jgi:hypothetical protein
MAMTTSQEEIALKVFKRLDIDDIGEYSLDDKMLSILMNLDEEKNIDTIAQDTGLSVDTTYEALLRLAELKFVECPEEAGATLDPAFFETLITKLAMAIGPIARFIVEDTVGDLGHTISSFPTSQAAELVDLLSHEIQKDEEQGRFKVDMIHIINEIGHHSR